MEAQRDSALEPLPGAWQDRPGLALSNGSFFVVSGAKLTGLGIHPPHEGSTKGGKPSTLGFASGFIGIILNDKGRQPSGELLCVFLGQS
jgi:hypothetical protein